MPDDPEAVFKMEDFWATAKEIKQNTELIDAWTSKLSQVHSRMLEAIDVEERTALTKQSEKLADEITKIGNNTRLLVKKLTDENKSIAQEVGAEEPSMRIRSNQASYFYTPMPFVANNGVPISWTCFPRHLLKP